MAYVSLVCGKSAQQLPTAPASSIPVSLLPSRFYRATACNATHGIAKAFFLRLSVCQTRGLEVVPTFLYHMKDHSVFWQEEWLVGRPILPQITFGQNWRTLWSRGLFATAKLLVVLCLQFFNTAPHHTILSILAKYLILSTFLQSDFIRRLTHLQPQPGGSSVRVRSFRASLDRFSWSEKLERATSDLVPVDPTVFAILFTSLRSCRHFPEA